MKKVVIISGGTMNPIATHLALCAPAYGATGHELWGLCQQRWNQLSRYIDPWEVKDKERKASIELMETRMAGGLRLDDGNRLETNADVAKLVDDLVDDVNVKVIFMPVALCDFDVSMIHRTERTGRTVVEPASRSTSRLLTRENRDVYLELLPAKKIIQQVRAKRKDIFLVGFKTTDGATEQEQYLAGLNLLKEASCNLVLANDAKTRVNMIITPEEAKYHVTEDRDTALKNLVEMAWLRSHLTFTRSTVIAGEPVPWDSPLVPASLRAVVDHCISAGAYKPFRGATVGHFACNITELTALSSPGRSVFLTSRRKTNFNDLPTLGLVRIETDGPDTVLAYGSKPSVGGQSQRIIFSEHPEYDCIVHFHCPRRQSPRGWVSELDGYERNIPTVSQREYECGSHQCGQNTSRGLKRFGNLACVFLDQHGPNIVFHHSIDPQEVIKFIDANFDLGQKTGGPV